MFVRSEIDRTEIGQRLRQVRRAKGLTQEKVAEDLALQGSKSRISRFEKGQINRLDQVEMFSRYYQVSAAFLLFGAEYEKITKEDVMSKNGLSETTHAEEERETPEKTFIVEGSFNLYEDQALCQFIDENELAFPDFSLLEKECKSAGVKIGNFVADECSVSLFQKEYLAEENRLSLAAIGADGIIISLCAIIRKSDIADKRIRSFLKESDHDDMFLGMSYDYLTDRAVEQITEDLLPLDDSAFVCLHSYSDTTIMLKDLKKSLIDAEKYFMPDIRAHVVPMTDSSYIFCESPSQQIVKATTENIKAATSAGYIVHKEKGESVKAYEQSFGIITY